MFHNQLWEWFSERAAGLPEKKQHAPILAISLACIWRGFHI